MAWRPTRFLSEGELENLTPGKVTGWMKFAGMKNRVTFDLKGDFHRDIRGARIRFKGDGKEENVEAASYMDSFAQHQTGNVGDITAGLPPHDYGDNPFIEWYSDQNGRVVIEIEPQQIKVVGNLLPWTQQEPVSREQQARNMGEFLGDIAQAANIPPDRMLCVGRKNPASTAKTSNTERNAK